MILSKYQNSMLASPIPKIDILLSLLCVIHNFKLKITSHNHKQSAYGPSLTKLISSTVLSLADCKIFTFQSKVFPVPRENREPGNIATGNH